MLDTMVTTTSHPSNPRAVFDKLTGAELCNRSVRALGSGLQLPARLAEPRRLLARRRGPQARTGDAWGGESARILTPRPHYCSARRLQYEPGSADLYVFGSPKNTEGYQFSKTFFGVIFANNPN